MSQTRGVVMMTVSEETAQMVDHVAFRYQINSEQVIAAAVSVMASELESRNDRYLRFMNMVSEDSKRQRETAVLMAAKIGA